jgi:hypothetical protein
VGIGTTTPQEKLHLYNGTLLVDSPVNPTLASSYSTIGSAYGLYVMGKYAYVADGTYGLEIFDVSGASSTLVGLYNTPGFSMDVFVQGKYAYFSDGGSGLQIFDISNPANPTIVGNYNPGFVYKTYLSGKYAYLASGGFGFRVVDISNPTKPTLVGNLAGSVNSVFVVGKFAYASLGNSGFSVIDISNPSNPTVVGSYDTTGSSSDIYVSGKYAYVADGSSGLSIFDISSSTNPVLVGTYDTPVSAAGVFVSGKYAYVSDSSSGLQIINISSPSNPVLVGTYDTPGSAQKAFVSGKYAYVADLTGGLIIIDLKGAEISAASIGNVFTNGLNVSENANIGNNLYVQSGINIGYGGIYTSGDLTAYGTLSVNGTSTIATTTISSSTVLSLNFTNATGTNLYVPGLFNFANASGTSVTSTFIYTSGLTFVNGNGTSLTSTNISSTLLNATNATITSGTISYINSTNVTSTGLVFTNANGVSVTSTNFFATTVFGTNSTFTSATTTNLSVSGALNLPSNSILDAMVVNTLTINGGTIDNTPVGATTPSTGVFTNLTSTNAIITSVTTTNLSTTNGTIANLTSTNFSVSGNAVISSLTSTNQNATRLTFTSATGTNLNITGNTTLGSVTSTNLNVSGVTSLAGLTFTTANGTTIVVTNATITNATTTNATTTNFAATGVTSLNTTTIASSTIGQANLTAALLGSATSTNFFASLLGFTNLSGTSITSTNFSGTRAVITNVTSTNLSLSGLFNFVNATGTSITSTNAAFTSSIKLVGIASCNGATQALQTAADGSVSCGTLATASGGGNVGTSTLGYFSFYNSPTSVTGTQYMAISGNKIAFTTNTTFTSSTVNYLNAGVVTSTFLQLVTTGSNTTFRSVSTGYSQFEIWHDSQGVTLNVDPGGGVPADLQIAANSGIHSVFKENGDFIFNPGSDPGLGVTVNGSLRVSGTTTLQSVTSTNLYVSGKSSLLNLSVGTTTGGGGIPLYVAANGTNQSAKFDGTVGIGTTADPNSNNVLTLGSIYDANLTIEAGDTGSSPGIFFNQGAGVNTARIFVINGTRDLALTTNYSGAGNIILDPNTGKGVVVGSTTPYAGSMFSVYGTSTFATTTISSSTIRTLNFTSATGTNLNLSGLFNFVNATGTSITSTNGYFSNLSVGSFNPTSLIVGSVTTTNLFATTTRIVSLTVTGTSTFATSTFNRYVGFGTTSPQAGVHVYDSTLLVDNPVHPKLLGNYADSSYINGVGVWVSGKYAYLPSANNGITVIDVSNPSYPTFISNTIDSRLSGASAIAGSGKYAYILANNKNGFGVVDISNPLAPTTTGFTSSTKLSYTSNWSGGLFATGKYVYAAVSSSLVIIDVSNPYAPTTTGYITSSTALNGAFGVYVQGKYAYVTAANGTGWLSVVDISNPYSPTIVGKAGGAAGAFMGVYVSGRYAYVTDYGNNDFDIFDVSNPTAPTLVSSLGDNVLFAGAMSVQVAGKYAYVADYNTTGGSTANLTVVDVSSTTAPRVVGKLTDATNLGWASNIVVMGKYAYIANLNSSFSVIDLGGADISTARIGSVESNSLMVLEDADIGRLNIRNGLNIGVGGLMANGGLTISGTSTLATTTITSAAITSLVTTGLTTTNFAVTNFSVANGLFTNVTTTNIYAANQLMVSGTAIVGYATDTNFVGEKLMVSGYGTTGIGVHNLAAGWAGTGEFTMASNGLWLGTLTHDNINIETNDISRMTIDADGSIGIGTYNPQGKLHVFDGTLLVDNPDTSMTVVGSYVSSTILSSWGDTVKVVGKYAYIGATEKNTFTILDVSRPSNPVFVGSVSSTALSFTSGLAVSGNYAYTYNGRKNSINVIDLSSLTQPRIVGSVSSTLLNYASAGSMDISGKYLFVAGAAGPVVVDISNPTSPTIAGYDNTVGPPNYVVVSGKNLYVTGNGTMGIFDISNPNVPKLLKLLTNATYLDNTQGIYVSGKYAYVISSNKNGLAVVDISSSTNPVITGFTSSTDLGGAINLKVAGKYAYVADVDRLTVVDISNPTAPTTTGFHYTSLGNTVNIDIAGKYAYLSGAFGLEIVDLLGADISAATIGSITTNDLTIWDNARLGNNLLVGNALNVGAGGIYTNGGLAVNGTTTLALSSSTSVGIGTNDPQAKLHVSAGGLLIDNPKLVERGHLGSNSFFTRARGMSVSGKYLYASMNNGIGILDTSNPNSPVLLGYTSSTISLNDISDIKVAGKYAYAVGSTGRSFTVVDVSDPTAPTTTAYITSTIFTDASALALSGNYAFVVAPNNHYLIAVDISNPESPKVVGTYSNNTRVNLPNAISIQGKYAYVKSYGNSSVAIFDISDPTNLILRGTVTDASRFNFMSDRGLYVSGRYAYVSSYNTNGLAVIDISSSTRPTVVGFTSSTALYRARGVTVAGKYAYVTSYSSNSYIAVVDISSSTSPTTTGYISGGSSLWYPTDAVVSGKYLYIGQEASGSPVVVLDVGGVDAAAATIGSLATNNLTVWDNADFGNMLNIRNGLTVGAGGIRTDGDVKVGGTLNVNNPTNPTVASYTFNPGGIGSLRDLAVSGKYAYLAGADGFGVVDITDPKNPSSVAMLPDTRVDGYGIEVVGNYAYVTGQHNNFTSIDISKPANPQIAGMVSSTRLSGPWDMAISGKYAYVVDNNLNGVTVIDISNPKSPKITGFTSSTELGGPTRIKIVGKYAYIAGNNGITTVDISDPTAPTTTANNGAGSCEGIYVTGRYAYCTRIWENSVSIFDISTSTAITLVSTITDPRLDQPYDVAVAGTNAYVTNWAGRTLATIDVSSTTVPVIVGMTSSSVEYVDSSRIVIAGKYLYSVGGMGNLVIFDLQGADISTANIGNLATNQLTVWEDGDFGKDLRVRSSLDVGSGGIFTDGGLSTYGTTTIAMNPSSSVGIGTNDPKGKLHVYDGTLLVDSPVNPKIAGSVAGWAETIYVQGKYAYATTYSNNGLAVIDISNPKTPVIVGSTSHPSLSSASGVYVSGNYAYVVARNGPTMAIVDVSKPTTPTTTALLTLTGGTEKIYVSGKYAYAVGTGGMYIVDISNPKAPTTTAYLNVTNAIGLYVSGNYAYVAGGSSNVVYIVNISNPTSPFIVSTITDATRLATPRSIYVSGRYAYVGGQNAASGLTILDISSTTAPTIVGFTSSTKIGSVWSVYVSGKYAYLGGSSQYFNVIDISSSTAPTTTGSYYLPYSVTGVFLSGKYAYVGTPSRLYAMDIGGADISAATIGNIAANDLTIWENADIGNNLYVRNGLNIGAGAMFQGAVTIASSSSSTLPLLTVYGGSLAVKDINTSSILTTSSLIIGGQTIDPDSGMSLVNTGYVSQIYGSRRYVELYSNLLVQSSLSVGTGYYAGDLGYAFDVGGNARITGTTTLATTTISSTTITNANITNLVVGSCTGCSGVGANISVQNVTTTNLYATGTVRLRGSLNIDSPTSFNFVGFTSSTAMNRASDVYVTGRYAYVVSDIGHSMSIVDITNPAVPVITGVVDTGGVGGTSIVVSGKYAYVATKWGTAFTVIDISNAKRPTVVGTLDKSILANITGIYLSGKYIYASANTSHSVIVIDISNPSAPTIAGSVTDTVRLNSLESIYVSGKYAYVTPWSQNHGPVILDISNPASPTITGVVSSTIYNGGTMDVYVSGKYAYVSADQGDLYIVDISSSTAPTTTGRLSDNSLYNGARIKVSGKYAYVASGNNDIAVVDVSSTTAPTLVTSISNALYTSGINSLYIAGKYVYVASGGANGLSVLDLKGADISAANVGNLATNQLTVWEDANFGNSLYVRNSLNVGTGGIFTDGGLNAASTSTFKTGAEVGTDLRVNGTLFADKPVNARLNSSVSNANNLVSIAVSGKYAYTADYDSGMSVYDISDPNNLVLIKSITINGGNGGFNYITVSGKYAYISGYTGNSLTVVDISDPTNPTVVKIYVDDYYLVQPHGIYISGKYAYVAAGGSGMAVVDISDPKNPKALNISGSGPMSVAVVGKYAYAVGSDSLNIVDVSDPTNPAVLVTDQSPAFLGAYRIYVSGKYAYITSETKNGLSIVDISSSTAPTTTAFVSSTYMNQAQGIYVSGKYAFVAGYGTNGIAMVDISSSTAPTTTGYIALGALSPNQVIVSGKYAYAIDASNLYSIDLGGADIVAANIGNLATNELTVYENANIGNLDIRTGLSVGQGGARVSGDTSVNNGLLEVKGATNPRLASWQYRDNVPLGQGVGVYVSGKYAYYADDLNDGLYIQDISDPKNPKMVGKTTSTAKLGGASYVFVVGKYAYVTARNKNALAIVDVSNPTAPTTTGFTSSSALNACSGIYVSGKYAYISAGGNNGMAIVDISNPRAPTTTASISDTNYLGGNSAIYVSGKYAYLDDGWNSGLTIVDISNANAPFVVGHTVDTKKYGWTYGITVSGRYAYLTSQEHNGLGIIDVSNPAAPTTTGYVSSTLLAGAVDVKVSGKYAYVAAYNIGAVAVVDISSSTAPTTTGYIYDGNLGQPWSIAISGHYAYVPDRWGLRVGIIDILGADISNANIGNIASNDLTVWDNADFGNNIYVRNGINAGSGGIASTGELVISSTSTFMGSVLIGTSTYFANAKLMIDAGTSTAYGLAIRGFARAAGGFFASTSLDLAERYPIDPACVANGNCPEAGDVICQSETSSSIVVEKCQSAYSNKVLGIVSTDPGFVLEGGFSESDSRRIALAGRVPVKISLENGPINFGDELAPASIPGYAMKATIAGPTVGKALENFSGSSTGTITAYVRLGWNHNALVQSVTSTSTNQSGSSFIDTIMSALSQIGIYIQQGIIRATEFVSNKVTTDELCVGNTCITEVELKALLEKNQIQSASQTSSNTSPGPTTSGTPIQNPPTDTTTTTTTTTTNTTPDTATTTPTTPLVVEAPTSSAPVVSETPAPSPTETTPVPVTTDPATVAGPTPVTEPAPTTDQTVTPAPTDPTQAAPVDTSSQTVTP